MKNISKNQSMFFYILSFVFILILLFIILKIINNKKAMGDFKSNIIEPLYYFYPFIVLIGLIVMRIKGFGTSVTIYNTISLIIIIVLSLLSIKFRNGIYENGLIIDYEKIYWENIRKIKKTKKHIIIIYIKNEKQKEIIKSIDKFDFSFIKEKKGIEIIDNS